ncbi:group I truncated hemoglobin [Nostoc sp.]|uniref:group I truncated hemoglobin n=1 Tax=Nostoc sp. TaxID=1180 RepID=UPI002FF668F8
MKIQTLFTKAFWLTLVSITVMVVTIFRLSPGLAHPRTTPGATFTIGEYHSQSLETSSLYRRLGGYSAIATIVDDMTQFALQDPLINQYWAHLSTDSKQKFRQGVVNQFCQVTGGACLYTGRTMKLVHSGMHGGITNNEFNAFVNAIVLALNKNNVRLKETSEVLVFVNSLRKEIVEK